MTDTPHLPHQDYHCWPHSTTYQGHTAGTFTIDPASNHITSIAAAEATLRDQGETIAIAPMQGNTWAAYRCITETDKTPAFFLEPNIPMEIGQSLQAAGYSPLCHYISARAMVQDTPYTPPRIPNISIQRVPTHDIPALMAKVFSMAAHAFVHKDFYAPITQDGFMALYTPIYTYLGDRARVYLAIDDNTHTPVGFLFGYDDPMSPPGTRMVFKTFSAHKRGAGAMLAWHFHEQARQEGYREVIHALMHTDNTSRKTSERFGGQVFRHYAVFGKALT